MAIQFSIYTCQPIPTAAASPDPTSDDAGLWSPLSCTLVYTEKTALLVDCPATVAATVELARWVKSELPAGCTLKYFLPSHAHGDHFLGFPILQDHFPSVTGVATHKVVEGIAQQHSPDVYHGLWEKNFPPAADGTGLPKSKAAFQTLPANKELELDGHLIQVFDVPHGDTHANSFIYVPELGLVVAGDIVYNGDCHQWLGEASTQEKRDKWISALSQIAALKPKVIVPGHTFTPVSTPDEAVAAGMLKGTEDYIKGFAEELDRTDDVQELFDRMRARYQRWNLFLLAGGCQAGMAAKQL
ncbi:beta-lactamase-like protein [Dactylonectria estremocensis]|uniref:Beta-lactamase-like protein n=1 Tax=Dactylonectria estremocensis TaxID=1079267 RepID=A0A9P9E2J0_9HYPO|nr:beta-lactamase-like protein [Dactylonectria estremocensis]